MQAPQIKQSVWILEREETLQRKEPDGAALLDQGLRQRWVFPEQATGINFGANRYFTEIQVGLDCGMSVWAHIEPGVGLYFHRDLTAAQKIEAVCRIEDYENSLRALIGGKNSQRRREGRESDGGSLPPQN